ncbi:hypothetical protein EJ02DRAFT_348638 [Clathrospora elynae]|uniref:Uncharacterized protein n=1 Tax=Clathrospora elynae TaxID=706981 RepID=A0A6A5SN65_9PLEO|nr:hypothetical protein EJ02DRAFT_348638 [Clathrospora elynae]
MSRPQSMPDFSALLDASTSSSSIFEKRIHSRRQTSPERKSLHLRKKPSISLAAGLMMNTENSAAASTPLNVPLPPSPRQCSQSRVTEQGIAGQEEGGNLFYAYALRSDYASSPPYILTFASAAVCSQWWDLVQHEYKMSSRPSLQFFVVRSEDMELIQDDPAFFHLRNKWFYTSQDSPMSPPIVIPLQSANGVPAVPAPPLAEKKASTSAIDSLAGSLTRLAGVVESNAEQVHALSVAQSAGLQRMQEINESNSTQINAIADSQMKLQALVDQNASHYIALSNQSFASQEQSRQSQDQTRKSQEQTRKSNEQTRDILKTTVFQLQTLSTNQIQLSKTCEDMMRSIESLGNSVSQMNSSLMSDTASNTSGMSAASFSALASRISPAPRKLNRRIKGVWYEYDNTATPSGTPRRRVDSVDTPPKSSIVFKNGLDMSR